MKLNRITKVIIIAAALAAVSTLTIGGIASASSYGQQNQGPNQPTSSSWNQSNGNQNNWQGTGNAPSSSKENPCPMPPVTTLPKKPCHKPVVVQTPPSTPPSTVVPTTPPATSTPTPVQPTLGAPVSVPAPSTPVAAQAPTPYVPTSNSAADTL